VEGKDVVGSADHLPPPASTDAVADGAAEAGPEVPPSGCITVVRVVAAVGSVTEVVETGPAVAGAAVVVDAVGFVTGAVVVVVTELEVIVELGVVVVGTTAVVAVVDEVTGVAVPGDASAGERIMVVVVEPYRNVRSDGNWMGFTNTMMQASTTRHAPAMPSSLRLRWSAPSRAARKKPLNKKNRMMLTELLTPPAYHLDARHPRC